MLDYDRYYDQISNIFNEIRLDKNAEITMTVSIIKNYLNDNPSAHILDIGCGTGKYAHPLHLCGYNVIGIDKSPSQIAVAKKHIPVVLGNSINLPFKDKCFDMCLCIMMIHQLSRKELSASINEASRVLKSNGLILIKTCSADDLLQRSSNKYFPSASKINLQRYHPIPFVVEVLNENGFSIIAQISTHINEPIRSDSWIFSIENKHNTTLALLPEEEYSMGIDLIKKDFPSPIMVDKFHHHTYIIAKTD